MLGWFEAVEHIRYPSSSRAYTRTIIDEKAGERMFCSEEEAEAAVWRAAGG